MATTILVVDDSTMVRQQLSRALTQAGYTIIEAVDGVDALEKVSAVSDLALVICDVNMPRMGGIDFLQSLRETPMRDTPVVMLTTEGHPETIQRAKQVGARGWIVKPFKPDLLLGAVRKLTGVA